MTETTKRTELVATVHGQHGTFKIAAKNAADMVRLLIDQTAAGFMVASLYEREATIYTTEELGR